MKNFELNQKVLWHTEDFDGTVDQSAVITEVHEDHCIATTEDGINLWVDRRHRRRVHHHRRGGVAL